jgi:hypothetical protein
VPSIPTIGETCVRLVVCAVGRVLGYSADGWIEWHCLRDGVLLDMKRDRWMRGAAV